MNVFLEKLGCFTIQFDFLAHARLCIFFVAVSWFNSVFV
jgi:hypothetical protein